MENQNKSYETLFVIDASLSEDGIKAVVDKFSTLIAANGEVTATNEWGKRKLAYPINDMTEGYYVLIDFTAPASFTAELERIFNITEGVIRSIVKRKIA